MRIISRDGGASCIRKSMRRASLWEFQTATFEKLREMFRFAVKPRSIGFGLHSGFSILRRSGSVTMVISLSSWAQTASRRLGAPLEPLTRKTPQAFAHRAF